MSFTEKQTRALSARLNHRHVRTRSQSGTTIPYVEGWHAISEANRIFGFDSWDRATVSPKCVWTTKERGLISCFYLSKVRITVRAGETVTVREGIGTGFAANASAELAHELALKAAETDATKRALATFGNPFGLALYDKSGSRVTKPKAPKDVGLTLSVSTKGEGQKLFHDVNAFVAEVRGALRGLQSIEDVYGFWSENIDSFTELRERQPVGGDLVISFLVNCFKTRLRELSPERRVEGEEIASIGLGTRECESTRKHGVTDRGAASADVNDVEASEKNSRTDVTTVTPGVPDSLQRAPFLKERRIRNKAHLAYVAQQPCLVCERKPTHAHHVRFAQHRAMSLKVSDEYTVPLCAIHHDQLHRAGNEKAWWEGVGIKDPLQFARRLWLRTQGQTEEDVCETSADPESKPLLGERGQRPRRLMDAGPSEEDVRKTEVRG